MFCPNCESDKLIKHGWQWRLTGNRRKVQRYRCTSCGRLTVYPAQYRDKKADS